MLFVAREFECVGALVDDPLVESIITGQTHMRFRTDLFDQVNLLIYLSPKSSNATMSTTLVSTTLIMAS